MTVSYDTTPLGAKHFKAAIHPYDNTIRPQRVSKTTCRTYYKLLQEFKKITGIGGLLNTSLNIHDKPIINQPLDIINEILENNTAKVGYLFIEDTLYIRNKNEKN